MAEPNAFDDIEDEPAAIVAPPALPGGNAFDDLDDDASPEALKRKASEVAPVDSLASAAPAGMTAKASFSTTPEVEIERYAKHYGQPVKDFKLLPNKKIARKDPKTGVYSYVVPSVFGGEEPGPHGFGERMRRAGHWAASGAGPAIPATTGGVGAGVAAAATLAATKNPKAAMAAGTAAGTVTGGVGEYTRQKIGNWLNDDDQPVDWANVGWQAVAGAANEPTAGALGALGRLAARIPGVKQIMAKTGLQTNRQLFNATRRAEEKFNEQNPLMLPRETLEDIQAALESHWDDVRTTTEDASQLGLGLSLGQRTRSPALQKLERWLSGTPEGAERFGRLRRTQNEEQVPAAARQVFDDVAPRGPGNPVEEFRSGADKVVGDAAGAQAKQAERAYRVALDNPDKPLPFTDDLRALFKRPMMKEAWERAQTSAANRGVELPKFVDFNAAGDPVFSKEIQPTWRSIDQIKRGLDQIKRDNVNAFGKPTGKGADASNLRRSLLDIVDPMNPEYVAARASFGESADVVDQILQGGVGKLQKMKGPDALNMVDRFFRGGRQDLMPDDVTEMRKLFVAAGKEKEWQAALRSYLDDGLDNATRRIQNGGEMGNVAGKMIDVWNTDRQRAVLTAALGDPAKANKVARLMNSLHHASSMLPEGSSTGANQEFAKATKNKVIGAVRGAYGLVTGHGAVNAGMDALESHLARITEPAARRQLIDFVLSPGADQALRRVLTNLPSDRAILYSPTARDRAAIQIGHLMTAAGISAGAALAPNTATNTED